MKPGWLALLLLLPSGAAAEHDVEACPDGAYSVATNNPLEPFHCEAQLRTDQPYITMTPTYKLHPCPKGKRAVETPGLGAARRYKCVPDRRRQADPSAAPLLPGDSARASRPGPAAAAGFAAPSEYVRVTERGAFQAEIPKGWQVTDGWDEDPPGFYVQFDTGRQGRQVELVVSKVERNQEDYASVDQAVARDKDSQNAAEGAPRRVAGFPARFTFVKDASRTAYVPISDEDYFVLSYTAPEDLYAVYEPVFQRLLSTLRIAKDQRR